MKTNKKISAVVLSLMFVFSTFFSSARTAKAGDIISSLIPFIDPVTSLIIIDRYSCDINVLWGCDAQGKPLPPPKPCQTSTAPNFGGIPGIGGTANDVNLATGCTFGLSWERAGASGNSAYMCNDGSWINPLNSASDAEGCVESWGDNCGNSSEKIIYCPLSGVCGSSNEGAFASAPSGNLCSVGNPTAVTVKSQNCGSDPCTDWSNLYDNNDNPYNSYAACQADLGAPVCTDVAPFWSWSCNGTNGGSATSCSANKITEGVINGSCGSANNQTLASTPTTISQLCLSGTPSIVSGNGPWTWICAGSGTGGLSVSCSALSGSGFTCPSPVTYSCYNPEPSCPSETGVAVCLDNCSNPAPGMCSGCTPKTITCSGGSSGGAGGANVGGFREVTP